MSVAARTSYLLPPNADAITHAVSYFADRLDRENATARRCRYDGDHGDLILYGWDFVSLEMAQYAGKMPCNKISLDYLVSTGLLVKTPHCDQEVMLTERGRILRRWLITYDRHRKGAAPNTVPGQLVEVFAITATWSHVRDTIEMVRINPHSIQSCVGVVEGFPSQEYIAVSRFDDAAMLLPSPTHVRLLSIPGVAHDR